MSDNTEEKLDAPKVQKAAEAVVDAGVISGQTNQGEHNKAFKLLHAEDKNPSGIMPALHENFGIVGELDESDMGSKVRGDSDVIALRDDYLNRGDHIIEAAKRVPRNGDNPLLKDFFKDYKTPVMDAYEYSKSLKEGQPGKSKTLEDVVERLMDCPWLDKLRVKYDSKASNPEYNNLESTVTLRPQDAIRQTENFAHEGFHATHQFLSKLYDHGKVSPREFEDIYMSGEADSMLTESRVQRDLNPNGEPTKFHFYRADGQTDSIKIQEYADKYGKQALVEFLRTAKPVGANARPYGEHYSSFYKAYVDNFDQNKPAVDKYITQWVASGHKREDI
ncbi:MAG TPA: hypothetical protein EYN91_10825 [Candidatus Melainabacteria bacterium]|jgi:hypothetical protein|nr:hypothetical protein [Candidatus Melainabacteria bacterium]